MLMNKTQMNDSSQLVFFIVIYDNKLVNIDNKSQILIEFITI